MVIQLLILKAYISKESELIKGGFSLFLLGIEGSYKISGIT